MTNFDNFDIIKLMNSRMRRKQGIPGLIVFTIICLVIVSGFALLRFSPKIVVAQAPKTPQKVKVNKKLAEPTVDLNKFVVDLSAWQRPQDIDYNVLSQQIIGAIVRVQNGPLKAEDGSAKKDGEDKAYQTHITELQKRGVPVAVYAYVNGKSNADMVQQAKDFYNRAHKYHPTYYWLDVEEDQMKDLNGGIEAYRAELAKLGVKHIGIYAQDWFITANKIDTSKFTSIWMADYGNNTGYWNASPDTTLTYDMQQFTDQGTLNGFDGHFDLNMIRTQAQYDKLFKGKD